MKPKVKTLTCHEQAMLRIASAPQPIGQKFNVGARVAIVDDRYYGKVGTVLYTYAHAFSGVDFKHYALDIDNQGYSAWYKEEQLALV